MSVRLLLDKLLTLSPCCSFSVRLHFILTVDNSCSLTVGSWLIPGTGALCPPANPHSQFGAPLSLSPAHSCERYSPLRNHRSAPYPNPYTHRNNSPSKLYFAAVWRWDVSFEQCASRLMLQKSRLLSSSVLSEGRGVALQRRSDNEYAFPQSLQWKKWGCIERLAPNLLDCVVLVLLCIPELPWLMRLNLL